MITPQINESIAKKIASESFVFEFHVSQPSFRKKVDANSFFSATNTQADILPDRLIVHKRLVRAKHLKPLGIAYKEFMKFLKAISLPGGLLTLGNGQYLVPLTLLPDLKEKLQTFIDAREKNIQEFESLYSQIIEESRVELAELYSHGDFPEFEHIRPLFRTQYKYISNSVPENFERISKEIYEQEQARIISECTASASLIRDTLREQFANLVDHLVERLSPDQETGKSKVFQKSTVENIQSFFTMFKTMNLTDDGELEILVNSAEQLLSGVEPSKLRTDEEIKSKVNEGFDKIKSSLSSMITVKSRKVELE